jgi:hypothetical protein
LDFWEVVKKAGLVDGSDTQALTSFNSTFSLTKISTKWSISQRKYIKNFQIKKLTAIF